MRRSIDVRAPLSDSRSRAPARRVLRAARARPPPRATMTSTAFEQLPLAGFHTKKVESLAVARGGAQLFAGTADGSLVLYECRPDYVDSYGNVARDQRPRGFECAVIEVRGGGPSTRGGQVAGGRARGRGITTDGACPCRRATRRSFHARRHVAAARDAAAGARASPGRSLACSTTTPAPSFPPRRLSRRLILRAPPLPTLRCSASSRARSGRWDRWKPCRRGARSSA